MSIIYSPILTPSMQKTLTIACIEFEANRRRLRNDVSKYLDDDEMRALDRDGAMLRAFAYWLDRNPETDRRQVLREVDLETLRQALFAVREFGARCRESERVLASVGARNAVAAVVRDRIDAERCDEALGDAIAIAEKKASTSPA